jgi:hypothetical protein
MTVLLIAHLSAQRVLEASAGLTRRTVAYGQQDASCAYLGTEDGSCKPRWKRCDLSVNSKRIDKSLANTDI